MEKIEKNGKLLWALFSRTNLFIAFGGRHAIDIDFIFFCVTIWIGFVRTNTTISIHYCTNGNFCNHLIESYDNATGKKKRIRTHTQQQRNQQQTNCISLNTHFMWIFSYLPLPSVRPAPAKNVHLHRALRFWLNFIHDDTINRFHYEAGSGWKSDDNCQLDYGSKNTMGKLMQDVLHTLTADRTHSKTYFLLYSAINFNGNAYSFSLSIDIVRIFVLLCVSTTNVYMPLIAQLKEHCEARAERQNIWTVTLLFIMICFGVTIWKTITVDADGGASFSARKIIELLDVRNEFICSF